LFTTQKLIGVLQQLTVTSSHDIAIEKKVSYLSLFQFKNLNINWHYTTAFAGRKLTSGQAVKAKKKWHFKEQIIFLWHHSQEKQ